MAQGLSGRPSLDKNSGMLFDFAKPGRYGFWMKEMNIPIDIIWLDDNWRVIDLTENISPPRLRSGQTLDSLTIYQPRAPARYVLEVNSGFTVAHQITIGAQIVLK